MAGMQVEWGIDLSSEHERYLAERVFKSPVIVYNYPKDIKVQCASCRKLHLICLDTGQLCSTMPVPKLQDMVPTKAADK